MQMMEQVVHSGECGVKGLRFEEHAPEHHTPPPAPRPEVFSPHTLGRSVTDLFY